MPIPRSKTATPLGVELLAPPWHTRALIVLMVAVAVTGTALGHRAAAPLPRSRILGFYLPLLLAQGALAFYVCRVGRPRSALRALLGRGWDSVGRGGADLALAAAGWVVVEASETALRQHGASGAATLAWLPHTGLERVVWVLVAITVGVCEELVYRGYLQTQLAAWTGRSTVAIALQATLFGVAHGEQGLAVAFRFALYGAGFGALARWRRSLVPGIACHIGIDLASGLLAAG